MPYKQILEWPNPALREPAVLVEKNSEKIASILRDLEDTLVVKNGGGLAANQIGYKEKIFILDCAAFGSEFINPESESSLLDNKNIWALINPKITSSEGTIEWQEGCLSVPWHNTRVKRAEKINVLYHTAGGEEKEILLDFPISAAFQHEFDHLQGKLYLDRISLLTSKRIKNSIIKKRKKINDFKKDMMRMNAPQPAKPKRIKKNTHLSKKEIKKRKSRKRANR